MGACGIMLPKLLHKKVIVLFRPEHNPTDAPVWGACSLFSTHMCSTLGACSLFSTQVCSTFGV